MMYDHRHLRQWLGILAVLILLSATLPSTPTLAQAPEDNQTNETVIFYEDFSDNSARWTLGKEWQIGPARASTGHEYGNPDPALDFTPGNDNGVAGVVIGGNAATFPSHMCYYLISNYINASVPGALTLEFYRWLNSDYTPHMQNKVQVFNGTAWITLWRSAGYPGETDSGWTKISYDLTPYKNSRMRIRFSHNVGRAEPYSVSSWNIDDIRIFATNAVVAWDDEYSTRQNVPLDVNQPGVLFNDRSPNGVRLTASLVSSVSHGSLNFTQYGTFTYTPQQGYLGQDSFVYSATNGTTSDTAVVNITVSEVNHPPVADDLTFSVRKNNTYSGMLNATDPDGDFLDISLVTRPLHGTAVVERDGSFTYTPAVGYTGADVFTFSASDGFLKDNGQVSITVTP